MDDGQELDDEIGAALQAVDDAGWSQLAELVRELQNVSRIANESRPWLEVEMDADGNEVLLVSGVSYIEPAERFMTLPYTLGLVVSFDWSGWDGTERYRSADALAAAPVQEAVKFLTAAFRAERFNEGIFGVLWEERLIPTALESILRWHRDR